MYQIILSRACQEIIYFYRYKINLKYASELHFNLCWLSSIVRMIIKILLAFIKGTMNEKTRLFNISNTCIPKTPFSISLSRVLDSKSLPESILQRFIQDCVTLEKRKNIVASEIVADADVARLVQATLQQNKRLKRKRR